MADTFSFKDFISVWTDQSLDVQGVDLEALWDGGGSVAEGYKDAGVYKDKSKFEENDIVPGENGPV